MSFTKENPLTKKRFNDEIKARELKFSENTSKFIFDNFQKKIDKSLEKIQNFIELCTIDKFYIHIIYNDGITTEIKKIIEKKGIYKVDDFELGWCLLDKDGFSTYDEQKAIGLALRLYPKSESRSIIKPKRIMKKKKKEEEKERNFLRDIQILTEEEEKERIEKERIEKERIEKERIEKKRKRVEDDGGIEGEPEKKKQKITNNKETH